MVGSIYKLLSWFSRKSETCSLRPLSSPSNPQQKDAVIQITPPPPPHFCPFSKGRYYELSLHFFAMNGMESKPRIKKLAIIITEKGSIFVIQAGTRVRKVDNRMPSRKNIHYGFSAAAVVDRPFHNCSVKKKFDSSKYFFRY